MIDTELVKEKFVSIARDILATDLTLVGESGDIPAVIKARAGGPVPEYPFVTVDITFSRDREGYLTCLLYTSPSPRDRQKSRMPSSA